MQEIVLNGIWEMKSQSGKQVLGKIPGSVYSFLLDAGEMEDPYYRENELDALKLLEEDYTFVRSFDVPKTLMDCPNKKLRFDGIDTIAEIFLNGSFLGRADNFHRYWEFDVNEVLRDQDNLLEVKIKSPIKYIRRKDEEYHVGGTVHAMRGFPHMRKPHCMFGWDWGPRLPDAGIWRDVRLLGYGAARLGDIRILQEHKEDVFLAVRAQAEMVKTAEAVSTAQEVEFRITLTDPLGKEIRLENGVPCRIEEPLLWWPNGLGEQPLYTVKVQLLLGGEVAEEARKRIGLRTLTIERRKDSYGESFAHKVNGQTFFAMGADYIPQDNILNRITPKRTRKLLEDCKSCHFNVIRVWGGGYYPTDDFYDACDELGLVVWQDMMFACANYLLDDAFEENITEEIRQNVRRLRHHVALGLWCGNNEMEWLSSQCKYEGSKTTQAHYIRINEHIIPHILKTEDPDTFYWPSSPSSGGSFEEPNSPDRGDVHNWDVWHAGVPFAAYREHCFRYLSEFGFQSFPCLETIKSFTLPQDRNVFSRVMERHQRNEGANGKILQYLSMTYLYPTSFETLLYASQLLQADAVRYGVEHFRRNRSDDRCMGAVYWQLNDIWPVASWASIDYYGRWKALQYAAARFFAPVMISCEEVCEITARTSVVQEPTPNVSTARLNVTNETAKRVRGTVGWELRSPDSRILSCGEEEVTVEPFSSLWLETMDFSDTDYRSNHLCYYFSQEGRIVSSGTVLFTAPKHYRFADPALTLKRKGSQITVTAKAFAKSVEIYGEDGYVRLSDNYFDMEAGERTVELLEGSCEKLAVRSVFDIR